MDFLIKDFIKGKSSNSVMADVYIIDQDHEFLKYYVCYILYGENIF